MRDSYAPMHATYCPHKSPNLNKNNLNPRCESLVTSLLKRNRVALLGVLRDAFLSGELDALILVAALAALLGAGDALCLLR